METFGLLFFFFLIFCSITGLKACSASNFMGFIGILFIALFLVIGGML